MINLFRRFSFNLVKSKTDEVNRKSRRSKILNKLKDIRKVIQRKANDGDENIQITYFNYSLMYVAVRLFARKYTGFDIKSRVHRTDEDKIITVISW